MAEQRMVLEGVVEIRTPMANLPINDPTEQRALSLRFAIDSTARHFDFTTDASKGSQEGQMDAMTKLIIKRATEFCTYIAGGEESA